MSKFAEFNPLSNEANFVLSDEWATPLTDKAYARKFDRLHPDLSMQNTRLDWMTVHARQLERDRAQLFDMLDKISVDCKDNALYDQACGVLAELEARDREQLGDAHGR